ncbi:u1 small nuclear ribonucleoprotein A, partial [Cladochytrium replicatum]
AQPPTERQKTLYLRNLNERKNIKVLKDALRTIFQRYGKVLEIRIQKCLRMKGQGFIVFETQEAADEAMKEMKDFPLFDKKLDIQYARWKSDKTAESDGTMVDHKRKREDDRSMLKYYLCKMNLQPFHYFKTAKPSDEYAPPNSILFVQNLPAETTSDILSALFQQFPGFKEVRMVPGKNDIAFVEYENETQSAGAKTQLHGFRITPEKEIKVTFAKKG